METKQSSIEWLQDKLNNVKPTQFCSIETIKEWVEQAKEMERELIKESCIMAIMKWNEWDKTNYLDLYDHKIEGADIWAEDYCKELYEEIEVPNPNFNNMKTKEKAEELIRKYYTFGINKQGQTLSWYECKKCALIAVDEMIKTAKDVFEHCWNHISWKAQYDIVDMNKYLSYLEEVKQEIEKL